MGWRHVDIVLSVYLDVRISMDICMQVCGSPLSTLVGWLARFNAGFHQCFSYISAVCFSWVSLPALNWSFQLTYSLFTPLFLKSLSNKLSFMKMSIHGYTCTRCTCRILQNILTNYSVLCISDLVNINVFSNIIYFCMVIIK